MTCSVLQTLLLRAAMTVALAVPLGLHAEILSLSVTLPSQSAAAGNSLSFTGVITNRTGQTLESTDLFLSFFAYDFDALTPNQLLGSVAFTLPDHTFSADTALFSVDVAPATVAGIYVLQVLLQDINGNLSNATDVTVQVTASAVPEPSSFTLLALGVLAFLGIGRRKRTQ